MTVSELLNQFKLLEKPKRGGQKVVYHAMDSSGNNVALKLIQNVSDPRVLQEIQILRYLSISNIPRIIDSGIVKDETVDEEVLYIVEQYIDGISLRDLINQGKTATLSEAYNLLHTLLAIECELEKNNILHRDINPNNIIVGDNQSVYLIDFGLAKILGGVSFTRTAAVNGPYTPGYAPHEQVGNLKMLQDVRTDLYEIGVTVYEYCAGRNPFVNKYDTISQINAKTMTLIPSQLILHGDTKGMFSQLVHTLMAKNQSQRPDTAGDAVRYLMAIKPTLLLEV